MSNEQPDFIYFECPDCGFDSIQRADFRGSHSCPLCAGDRGRDVAMTSRVCRSEDTAEGFDARKGTRVQQEAIRKGVQMTTPGSILHGIVLIHEPESVSVNTFEANGEVLLTFNCRRGGDCGQVIIGLSPFQAVQLIERLQMHNDIYARAIAEGKGGAEFVERK